MKNISDPKCTEFKLKNNRIDNSLMRLIPEELIKKNLVIPLKKEKDKLLIGLEDPTDLFIIDKISKLVNMDVESIRLPKGELLSIIEEYYEKSIFEKEIKGYTDEYITENNSYLEYEKDDTLGSGPIAKMIDSIVKQAIESRATDIHIEPFDKFIKVRFRVDGLLRRAIDLPPTTYSGIITRIKIMSKLNIAEKRIPQDGRMEIKTENCIFDLRISTLPTIHGEKICIRILDRKYLFSSKHNLGFLDENLERFNDLIEHTKGLLLTVGPTGVGKSTTMYTILNEINKEYKNIITIEDPVEYKLDDINQVQVNNKAGVTFSTGLKSILRQDPDIIMVGEIRDTETAQLAIRASMTGHLVLSTLHTNDAPLTIARLIDMGIEPYLISSSLIGVISQRLVRKICNHCKKSYIPNEYEQEILNVDASNLLYRGNGCDKCKNTGYLGRTAIHEIMLINDEIRKLIDGNKSIEKIRDKLCEKGMTTMIQNCKRLLFKGVTSLEEYLNLLHTF
ncbi:type IV pilus assembly protein TapB [Gottschalkia purinilytica]|uniref:Type IV pilus assembly protein TapB n=1 Tax=Gottschalkia purinilytica TaxID=1503 RepID=A0A0L0WEJ8_GOTPU|nr:GspE/PulE family protein [Gottschalkia purinilytica]KNF09861.1 type IV pilus assembly protein TapB [Gottschalkia purinilytica]